MERTHMAYFLEVCRSGSIGKAGKSLNVTPQAVSKAVGMLEKEIGCKLLERSAGGCRLTAEGREVQRLGNRMQRFNEQIMAQIQNLATNTVNKQEVHIAVSGAFASIMPVDDYVDFKELYPWITLCFRSCQSPQECERQLMEGKADLAFCAQVGGSSNIECLQEYSASVYIIVNKHSKLASRASVQLSDLTEVKVIADYLRDGTIQFDEQLRGAEITPALVLPPFSDALKRSIVASGDYAAFSHCPVGWLPDSVVPVRITDLQRFEYSFFSKMNDRELSEAAQKYVDFIVPRFRKDIFKV